MVGILDAVIAVGVWLVGNMVFRKFGAHVPLWQRLLKLLVFMYILLLIGYLGGKSAFYIVLGVLSLAVIILHIWGTSKRGIHWLTAESLKK